MKSQEIQKKITLLLKARNAEYVAIFGSAARDEARKDSDIDILVRFRKDISLLDHIGIAYELEDALGKRVDLITERSLGKYIAPQVKKDLKVLYGRTTRSDLL